MRFGRNVVIIKAERWRTHRADVWDCVGVCLVGGPGAVLLPVRQLLQPLAELFNGLALVGEHQEPEPFRGAGLLYKQFAWRWAFSFSPLPFFHALRRFALACGVFPVAMVVLYYGVYINVNTTEYSLENCTTLRSIAWHSLYKMYTAEYNINVL